MHLTIRDATTGDIDAIVSVVNAAYVVEEEFRLRGKRTDADDVAAHLKTGSFLVALDGESTAGCVYVEATAARGYFGMLSVDPDRQYGGLGKQLVAAAEQWCRERGCTEMTITVVNARTVLFPWYGKLGYTETGREPFPQPERMTIPVEMVVMRKPLAPIEAKQGAIHG
jgi:GNAT superfamily N-acetyltransferase